LASPALHVPRVTRAAAALAGVLLPHLGVQITPDLHVQGGMALACQVTPELMQCMFICVLIYDYAIYM
jgi:hypothetical protein